MPRAPDVTLAGDAEAALQNGSPASARGDESPTRLPPLYAPNVAVGPFPWVSEVEERFVRFVSIRISVRRAAARLSAKCRPCCGALQCHELGWSTASNHTAK